MMVSFLVSGIITEIQSRRIQREAASIAQNSLAATEALSAVRTDLRDLVATIDMLRGNAAAGASQARRELDASREALANSWAEYVAIPFFPGERQLVKEVESDVENA